MPISNHSSRADRVINASSSPFSELDNPFRLKDAAALTWSAAPQIAMAKFTISCREFVRVLWGRSMSFEVASKSCSATNSDSTQAWRSVSGPWTTPVAPPGTMTPDA